MDVNIKVEGVCEEDGPVHRLHGAVSDVEQCGGVVKAQVAARRKQNSEDLYSASLSCFTKSCKFTN